MDQDPLSPTNDYVFKKVFGENLYVLTEFLKAVLVLPPEDYEGITVVNPFLDRYALEDKQGILDIKIQTRSGKTIDVEVQVRPQRSVWKRMLYYTTKMLVGQIQRGQDYARITSAISILIADFTLIGDNDDYHSRYRLFNDKTLAPYPETLEINILEIPKARKNDNSILNDWLTFFAAKTEEQFMTIAEKNPAIAQAWGTIKKLSADEEERQLAEYREKARMDYQDNYNGAYNDGVEDAIEKVARAALRTKMPFEQIAGITGLSIAEIERLASES